MEIASSLVPGFWVLGSCPPPPPPPPPLVLTTLTFNHNAALENCQFLYRLRLGGLRVNHCKVMSSAKVSAQVDN